MKSCGNLMKILALVFALALICVTIGGAILDGEYYKEQWEDLEESIEKHEKEHEENPDMDKEECWDCENNEDRKKSLERNETYNILSLVQAIALYLTYCATLFVVGEIAAKQGRATKKETVAPVAAATPAAPSTVFCPKCGSTLPAGTRFCGTCGTTLGQ